jgi:hypothetical protein
MGRSERNKFAGYGYVACFAAGFVGSMLGAVFCGMSADAIALAYMLFPISSGFAACAWTIYLFADR